MAAIITDQLRILNAKNFVAGVQSSSNSYYAFIGLPDSASYQTDWNTDPPAPKDSFKEENLYHDSMLFLKKVSSDDVVRVIKRNNWQLGITYDMYKNDYSIDKEASQTSAKS